MPVVCTNARRARAACPRIAPLPTSAIGILGGVDQLCGALELLAAGLGLDWLAARERGGVEGEGHHVFGQLEVGGARLLRFGHLECLPHHLGHDLWARDPGVPLNDRPENADEIDVLVGLFVHALEVRLAGQGDQWGTVQERIRHGGEQVGGAGADRPEAHTSPASQAAVGVGHVGPALLMTNRYELDRRRSSQGFVEVERLLARNPEHVADPLGLEALDEHI